MTPRIVNKHRRRAVSQSQSSSGTSSEEREQMRFSDSDYGLGLMRDLNMSVPELILCGGLRQDRIPITRNHEGKKILIKQ